MIDLVVVGALLSLAAFAPMAKPSPPTPPPFPPLDLEALEPATPALLIGPRKSWHCGNLRWRRSTFRDEMRASVDWMK